LPGRTGRWFPAGRNDDINLELNELGRKVRLAVKLSFRRAALSDDVLIFNLAKIAEP